MHEPRIGAVLRFSQVGRALLTAWNVVVRLPPVEFWN
jgi:hypothetical protein